VGVIVNPVSLPENSAPDAQSLDCPGRFSKRNLLQAIYRYLTGSLPRALQEGAKMSITHKRSTYLEDISRDAAVNPKFLFDNVESNSIAPTFLIMEETYFAE
jgi:hypothetical protein